MHVEGVFKCKYENCNFVAKFQKELLYHKTTKHMLKTCDECGRTVPSNCYQRHLKVHLQIKNYACSWPDCGKAFSESKTLKDHVRVHLNFKVGIYCNFWNSFLMFHSRNIVANGQIVQWLASSNPISSLTFVYVILKV